MQNSTLLHPAHFAIGYTTQSVACTQCAWSTIN